MSTGLTSSGVVYESLGPEAQREAVLPVVLIHAGIADRRMWDRQWEPLTAARPAVRLDLRGYGESVTRPDGPLDHVSDVLEVLDVVRIDRCHLVGSSYGSGVATEVALTRPDVVESLFLCPPGGSLLAKLTPDLKRFFDAEKSALERHDLDGAVEANIDWWVVGPTRDRATVDPAVIGDVRVMQRNAFEVQEQWGDVAEVELDPPALDRLDELTARTLLLDGGHDLATTADAASRLVAGITDVRHVHWPDVAHLPSMENPGEFLDLLLDWTAPDPRSPTSPTTVGGAGGHPRTK